MPDPLDLRANSKTRERLQMKFFTRYLTFEVPSRMDFVNITPDIAGIVDESEIQEGIVLCNAMHITASVFINDDEPGLLRDYKRWLEQLAPFDPTPDRYHHNRTGEDNADAHHKRQIMGAKSSWRSRPANWIWAPGNKFFTESLTDDVPNECWSRCWASD